MKLIFIISCIFQFFFVNAQEKYNVCIEYNAEMNKFHSVAFLLGGKSDSSFFLSEKENNISIDFYKNSKININWYFSFFYNNTENKIYKPISYACRNITKNNIGMSIEEVHDIVWNIKKEYKKILGYNCTMATANFRGRKWIVWFTTEISGNFFPWKLKGSPGVILAFNDEDKMFNFDAVKITLNKKIPEEFLNRINNFFTKNKDKLIPYSEDVKFENIWLDEERSKALSNLPVGTYALEENLRSAMIEKTFEWEENKKP